MSTKAGKRPLRTLSAEEKLAAIRRVSVGGESKASVARDIGVPESTLRGWCKNESKISYQVRRSPSNLEESHENISLPPAKRVKVEEPYNLSMKRNEGSTESFSPASESNNSEYHKSSEPESETSPLNLRTTKPPEPIAPAVTSTPKTSNCNLAAEKDKQAEKNRAALAQLSVELGLNRPEVLLSTLNNGNSNGTDLTTAFLQWKNLYQTWILQQQQRLLHQQNKPNTVPPAPLPAPIPEPKVCSPAGNGLLTTVDKRDKMLQSIDHQQPSVYDSVSYWLRQQSLMGCAGINANQHSTITSSIPSTSATTSYTNTTPAAAAASGDLNQNLKLWNWYQQSVYNAVQMQTTPAHRDTEAILYQQLTKEPSSDREVNSENVVTKEDKPKNNTKNRSVLDNLLLNNNTIKPLVRSEGVPMDPMVAIEHGEIFLNFLEHCSSPSVTSLQLQNLQNLIKKLKSDYHGPGPDAQHRLKVKRK